MLDKSGIPVDSLSCINSERSEYAALDSWEPPESASPSRQALLCCDPRAKRKPVHFVSKITAKTIHRARWRRS